MGQICFNNVGAGAMSDNDKISKAPFRMYSSEEEIAEKKKKTWTFTVRVNAEEQKLIEEIKKLLNLKNNGTALKVSARVGLNVLQTTFSADILRRLTDPTRRRDE